MKIADQLPRVMKSTTLSVLFHSEISFMSLMVYKLAPLVMESAQMRHGLHLPKSRFKQGLRSTQAVRLDSILWQSLETRLLSLRRRSRSRKHWSNGLSRREVENYQRMLPQEVVILVNMLLLLMRSKT